jgi:cytochrome oxidase Cu insertion factor (SCO1/SenC/PrrC family)
VDLVRAPSRRALMRRLYVISVGAAAIVGIAVGFVLHNTLMARSARADAPKLPALYGQATWKAGRVRAPRFALRDQHGRRVSLVSYRGRTVVLLFMDSLCRQECPIEGRSLAVAVRQVPAADRPAVLIVSVNLRDTPSTIADAASHWNLPAGYEWLLGTHAQLARVWSDYHIAVLPTKDGGVDHSDAFYVIDRHGDERVGFISPFEPSFLAYDLKKLAVASRT